MISFFDETISQCLRGCPDAWRVLFEAHAPVVYHVLREIGATHEEAEDVVGDSFLQLIENRAACLSRAHF
ncbi:sigma-70 family RNA polymerase sigma factor, partial [Candidatus Fermentibacteria bacterium]|nr:sigma-70 family RNA polymerase sigma factor [Candidatus Fermentibacteria bacterium]